LVSVEWFNERRVGLVRICEEIVVLKLFLFLQVVGLKNCCVAGVEKWRELFFRRFLMNFGLFLAI